MSTTIICSICGGPETDAIAAYVCPDCGDSFCTECNRGDEEGRCDECSRAHAADEASFRAGIPALP